MAEKFSNFRDAATGLAPFVQAVSPRSTLSPALVAVISIGYVLGALRVALIAILFLVKGILDVLSLFASGHTKTLVSLQKWTAFFICRLALFLLGYYHIPVEHSQSLKRGTGRTNLPPEHPTKGDLILTNWTSYIDILYLSFRYNPTYLQPVIDARTKAILGFRKSGLLRMIATCGRLPVEVIQTPTDLLSIETHLDRAQNPCCIFPELTTTNNRALLPFADLSRTANGLKIPRTYLYAFRHEVPSDLKPSATVPIPTALNPFGHLLRLASSLFLPRNMTVRQLHYTEVPRATLNTSAFWVASGEATAQLAKLKAIKTLSWKDKASFLHYYERQKSA